MKLIAEIGWNHMGDMELAKKMIKEAAKAGADYCKFQTWSEKQLKKGSWDTDGRREIYKKNIISERHRHRYEVNFKYIDDFKTKGLLFSGMSPDNSLPEILELRSHPWFVAVQFHPELKSRPFDPHPLFSSFIGAALNQSRLL